ncbi:Ger(x)C family spore germination protein [Cohnella rhizosphaerae]|uniref:Ger(X)C family spore germination protein n=1 Tax=Cohnella rhizosphaerae TaxID=1457232 RepID=A0A9X4L4F3_9BACL|nr:Ger(x)C family spore germination protein [Cohnella rhizosphaerae]MDG0813594.1 Ger(x)C family spore germination protein [Cohnella rhizosphaerae]
MKWAKMCRILAASMVLPLSAGCWDRLEINDLALVMATGLDEAEDGQVKLSVQIFVPKKAGDTPNVGGDQASGGGGGGSQTIVKEATGISVADAVSRLQTMMSRRLTWEHDEVFIFGEKRAAHGIEEDMDYLLRSRQTRERANLFVSEGMAIDALRLNPRLERDVAETLREMTLLQIGPDVSLFKLLRMMRSAGKSAVLPYIQKLPSQPGVNPDNTVSYITGGTVLKNGKAVGRLNMRLTRGLLWLHNETKEATLTFKPEGMPGSVALRMLRSKAVLVPSIRGDRWSVRVKVDNEAVLLQNTTGGIVTNEAWVQKIERAASQSIRSRIEETVEAGQRQFNADIFGIADLFRKHYPKHWKEARTNWDSVFKEIRIEIDVHTHVKRPGMSNASVPY